MIKTIQVVSGGRIVEAEGYSWDDGKTWCSSPKAVIAYRRRCQAALNTRLSEREIRWIDQLDREPDYQVDSFSIQSALRFQA